MSKSDNNVGAKKLALIRLSKIAKIATVNSNNLWCELQINNYYEESELKEKLGRNGRLSVFSKMFDMAQAASDFKFF